MQCPNKTLLDFQMPRQGTEWVPNSGYFFRFAAALFRLVAIWLRKYQFVFANGQEICKTKRDQQSDQILASGGMEFSVFKTAQVQHPLHQFITSFSFNFALSFNVTQAILASAIGQVDLGETDVQLTAMNCQQP